MLSPKITRRSGAHTPNTAHLYKHAVSHATLAVSLRDFIHGNACSRLKSRTDTAPTLPIPRILYKRTVSTPTLAVSERDFMHMLMLSGGLRAKPAHGYHGHARRIRRNTVCAITPRAFATSNARYRTDTTTTLAVSGRGF